MEERKGKEKEERKGRGRKEVKENEKAKEGIFIVIRPYGQ